MSRKLYDLARMTTATTGTGAVALGAAVNGFLTLAQAGAQDLDTITYGIADGANAEIGSGTYHAGAQLITRDVVFRSTAGGGNQGFINLSGSAQIYITISAADIAAAAGVSGFAPLDSPDFINTPTAPTRAVGDNSLGLANTQFTQQNIKAYRTGVFWAGLGTVAGSSANAITITDATLSGWDTSTLYGLVPLAGNYGSAGVTITLNPLSGGTAIPLLEIDNTVLRFNRLKPGFPIHFRYSNLSPGPMLFIVDRDIRRQIVEAHIDAAASAMAQVRAYARSNFLDQTPRAQYTFTYNFWDNPRGADLGEAAFLPSRFVSTPLAFGDTATLTASQTLYLGVGRSSSAVGTAVFPCPRPGVIRDLQAWTKTAPAVGQSLTYDLYKNGSSTGLTCTISGAATTATDNTDTVSVIAGDLLEVRVDASSGAATTASVAASVAYGVQ